MKNPNIHLTLNIAMALVFVAIVALYFNGKELDVFVIIMAMLFCVGLIIRHLDYLFKKHEQPHKRINGA